MRRTIFPVTVLLLASLLGCYSGSRPLHIGTGAPEFAVQDVERRVTLSQFRGQVVVLNFWATWCPPCVEETPSLINLSRRFKQKGVVVVGVSVDVDRDAYQRFVRDHGIDYITVRDPDQRSSNLYGTFKFPETYIIDRRGMLCRKFVGEVDWNSPEIVDFLSKLSAT